ncbi:uncharacterized protein LOC117174636 [Belonocnema kinseyi]|uniref:uncharacterized protein LOC117174636 n=1 Tax=Belonocnema kinseyi TaxID=2817044 RepID=UPI00143DFA9A|nr:uncharacterized protein LOC117174636 [Belonocnema kinseyi]
MMRFGNKRAMFKQIALDLDLELQLTYTGDQCDARFKTIKRRGTGALKHNSTTGNSRKVIEFEEELNQLRQIDDSFQPEVLMSAERMELQAKDKPIKTESNKKRARPSEIILQMHEERETNKRMRYEEREQKKKDRHEEKMQLLRQLINPK